jgi:hypothetical protein
MLNKIFNTAKVVSLFLTLFTTVLSTNKLLIVKIKEGKISKRLV